MKLLFICNATYAQNNFHIGSWIEGIISNLDPEIDLVVLGSNNDKKMGKIEKIDIWALNHSIKYYSAKAASFAENVIDTMNAEKPDVIISFGTEYRFTYDAVVAAKKMNILSRVIVYAQGFSSVCGRHYVEGLPDRVIKRTTFRDFLRRDNIKSQIKKFNDRAAIENKALRLAQNMIGRTTMDHALLYNCNKNASYYKCNEILRNCFYHGEWSFEQCRKHSIFVSQYYYPLKGFHYLMEAIAIVNERYPDVSVVAAGYNPIGENIEKKLISDSSYITYLRDLAKKLGISRHFKFAGELSSEKMKEEYLRANVFVLPSTIENSPNSLAEAMYLGVPSVAADVGGVSDFAIHKKEAYLYPSSASYMLAYYIMKVFDDPEEAAQMGARGRKRAIREYDKSNNSKRFMEIMKYVAEKGETI